MQILAIIEALRMVLKTTAQRRKKDSLAIDRQIIRDIEPRQGLVFTGCIGFGQNRRHLSCLWREQHGYALACAVVRLARSQYKIFSGLDRNLSARRISSSFRHPGWKMPLAQHFLEIGSGLTATRQIAYGDRSICIGRLTQDKATCDDRNNRKTFSDHFLVFSWMDRCLSI